METTNYSIVGSAMPAGKCIVTFQKSSWLHRLLLSHVMNAMRSQSPHANHGRITVDAGA